MASQVLLRGRTYNGTDWGAWRPLYTRAPKPEGLVFNVSGGGQLRIYSNLLSEEQQNAVTRELLDCTHFRQYTIQNNPEPRAHFLLHEKATDNFDGEEQPGYRYGAIRMKSRPLNLLPEVQQLAKDIEATVFSDYLDEGIADESMLEFGVCFWNVGVNPVLYRDGRDRIGYHADDDQGEELIVSAIVSSPAHTTRRVCLRSKKKKNGNVEGDEQLELYLDAGDVYTMDGELQKHYEHGIPADQKTKKTETAVGSLEGGQKKNHRIAIVFRRGLLVKQQSDSGQSCASLQPRPPPVPYKFGCIQGLREGFTYTRVKLNEMHAHRSQQKGISGNKEVGCDAIIVSGLKKGNKTEDKLSWLEYAASSQEGALSVWKSRDQKLPIRVFRSSILKSHYKAVSRDASRACYRYDGLYRVTQVYSLSSKPPTLVKRPVEQPGIVYCFHLTRIRKGAGPLANTLPLNELLNQSISTQSMLAEARDLVQGKISKGTRRRKRKL